jgi:hypothetical protein
MSSTPFIAASLILPPSDEINDTEKTPRNIPVWKKFAKVNHCFYSSTEQLQVAL